MTRLADVLVPPNAEGTRATVLRWCKQVGDTVVKDEPLVELETDKVTVEIPAPADGTLVEVLKQVNAEVLQDEILARLSLDCARPPAAVAPTMMPQPETGEPAGAPAETPDETPAEAPAGTPAAAAALSPSVRRLLEAHSLAATEIEGTGRDGRITAQDVTRHVANSSQQPPAAESLRAPAAMRARTVPHGAIRRRVAEHMARSMIEAPHVTTLFEADFTRVLAHKVRHAADYEARGAHLTLTAYLVSACARALRTHGEVNATFHAEALELHEEVNIGVGTALGNQGLIVPVIHGAQHLSLFAIAQRLGELVGAARAGKLAPEDVRGGTFTISNHGTGGSLLAAPIVINQPQVAILGAGKVERRVRVIEAEGGEAICVRSMCYLTLTIDHRAIDAFQANAFLSAVVAALDQWPADEP